MKLERVELKNIVFSEDGRGKITKTSVEELMKSIKEGGLIQPITVTKNGSGKYTLVAGRRRYKAFEYLGEKEIPVIVQKLDDKEAFNMQIVENLQRKDLTPLQFANTLKDCKLKTKMSIKEIALRTGKPQAYIARMGTLNNLIEQYKAWLGRNLIELSVALELARYDAVIQKDIFKELGDEEFLGDDYNFPITAEALKQEIASRYFTRLDKVPWKLDDEKLLAKAGSCAKCSKRTKATEFLFDDMEKDNCLDADCFHAKHIAVVKLRIAKIEKTGADYRLVVSYHLSANDKAQFQKEYNKLVLSAGEFVDDEKKYPKKLNRYVAIEVDSDNPKAIGRTYNILLREDVNAWEDAKKGDKPGATTSVERNSSGGVKDKSVDDYYNNKIQKNKYRSRYAATRIMIKEVLKKGLKVDEKNMKQLAKLVYSQIGYSERSRSFKAVFPENKTDANNQAGVGKLIDAYKGMANIFVMMYLFINEVTYDEPENYCRGGSADNLEEIAKNCGVDVKAIAKETDVEYAKERKHLKERFVHNHGRNPKE